MTTAEQELLWSFLETLYQQQAKARADVQALLEILKLKTGEPASTCAQYLELFRSSPAYQEYLKECAARLDPIRAAFRDQREKQLAELLLALPVSGTVN
jgi:hypothetical protein